ncbi:uncharacterized LOC100210581 [Hydra vulgaris]|uniref:Ephrin-B1 protein n=1 Tax=Hydra vulgaris TaxID=6087 RepID=R9WY58_HYDVU|nr:uncharacterized LOC100210581 [Hydra vulgaris]AGO06067.1 Ephrin-B1 protein [Hydra vulgaris]
MTNLFNIQKDCVRNMQIALILGCWSLLVHAESVILPTIYWDPINPLFACENTIQVEYDDVLNFKCRDSSIPYSQSIDDTDILYENAYFLGTNQYMYDTCNATDASEQILNCNGGTNSIDSYRMVFSKYSPSGKSTFKDGETYYIIGTGFRFKPNLANLINGSCNYVYKSGQYKLRLKIYVCSPEETCKKCNSDACYFKDCQVDCTSWETNYLQLIKSNNSCVSLQTRNCTNQLIGTVSIEKREIPITCPTLSTFTVPTLSTSNVPNLSTSTVSTPSTSTVTQSLSSRDFNLSCTLWQTDYLKIITSSDKNCSYLRTRRCKNQENTRVELEEIPTICPNTTSFPIVASVVGENNNKQTLTYIAIFVSILAFLFGIFFGVFILKCFILKSECRDYQTKDCGMQNSAYTGSTDFKKGNEINYIEKINNSHV